jgi:type III secretory pathway component EscS
MALTTSRELMLQVTREGILLALLVSGPPVLASWLAGLAVGVFQAVTQIQEPSIAFVPRLLAVGLTLLAVGPTLAAQVMRFAEALLLAVPHLR